MVFDKFSIVHMFPAWQFERAKGDGVGINYRGPDCWLSAHHSCLLGSTILFVKVSRINRIVDIIKLFDLSWRGSIHPSLTSAFPFTQSVTICLYVVLLNAWFADSCVFNASKYSINLMAASGKRSDDFVNAKQWRPASGKSTVKHGRNST